MNKLQIGLLIFAVFTSTSSQRVARFSDEVERGNKFIDDLLRDMISEHGHEYDPYNLEDSSLGFWKKIAFVNVSGEAKLHNGYINGLTTLHRADQCTVEEEDGKLQVSADLGAGILACHYDGTVKFMNWGPTISIYGEIKYLEIMMKFSVDAKTGRDGVLDVYQIYDLKGMTVEITGLGPLNWAANYLIGGITSLFQGFIKRIIESNVRSYIETRLPNYQFPVDDSATEIPEAAGPEIVDQPEEAFPFAKKFIPLNNFGF